MKIAILGTTYIPMPVPNELLPVGWARSTTDLFVDITNGLVDRDHDVTLYASGNSKTKAKLRYLWDKSAIELEEDFRNKVDWNLTYDHILASFCLEENKSENYDIILAFHSYDYATYANLTKTPIATIMHGGHFYHDEVMGSKLVKKPYFIGISQFQIDTMKYFNYCGLVYHGINGKEFKFNESNSESLCIVGRISSDKGQTIACDIANKLNVELDIIGTTHWQPLLDEIQSKNENNNIHLLGQLPKTEVQKVVANSKAFIFPITWNEPFGLVLIESLACGTPIVAYANGSLPEIVEDGKTGFLVNFSEDKVRGNFVTKKTGYEGLLEAAERLYSLSKEEYLQMRKNCREEFEKRFTKEIMVENYEKLFEKIIKERKK